MRLTLRGHRPEQQADAKAPSVAKGGPALSDVMSLQASIGNAAVGQLFGAQERAAAEAPYDVSPQTQDAVDAQMGAGQGLEGSLRTEMEGVTGAPLGDVHLHRGREADTLARSLGATAFTQGRDVFLRSDRDPASAQGRATLAHELTHVARGSVGAGAVLREPAKGEERVPGVVAQITLDKGVVQGESKVAGHEGEVEFDSFGTGSSSSSGPGRTGGAKPGEFVDMVAGRAMDKASPVLAEAAAKGHHIESARFQFLRRTDDGGIEDIMSLEFKDGYITSYTTGSSGDGGAIESLNFQFKVPEAK